MALGLVSPGKASVLIDGQYGSTGKGLAAAYVAKKDKIDFAVTNAAPNAGHTTIHEGKKFVAFHLPTAAVVQPTAVAYLDAGAVIEPSLFLKELQAAKEFNPRFNPGNVIIHPRAAILEPEDTTNEKNADTTVAQIAGTKKGVGSAIMRKVARKARLADDHPDLKDFIYKLDLNREMEQNRASVLVEVPQGFGLGINSGLSYPYCTSRDVTVGQAFADAGIHPHFMGRTMVCLRTFPIRVGNVYDASGAISEYSGPCYADQQEIKFTDLGVEPEVTTVTKRVRRIFTWSRLQFNECADALRPDIFFVNFTNYVKSRDYFVNQILGDIFKWQERHGRRASARDVIVGLGPEIRDIFNWSSEMNLIDSRQGW